MKVLVDTNVVINYLTHRDDKYRDSSIQVMEICASKAIEGYIAFHSLSIIWFYSVREKKPDEVRREWLDRVCKILTTSSAEHEAVVDAAHNVEFKDFEDNLQDCCAVSAGCDYIVTNDRRHYDFSDIPHFTSAAFVGQLDFLL